MTLNKIENQKINCVFEVPTLKKVLKKTQTTNQKHKCIIVCFTLFLKLILINTNEIKNVVLFYKYRRFSVSTIVYTSFVMVLKKTF